MATKREDQSTDRRVVLAVVGDEGAIHYWHEESTMPHFGEKYFGGVEIHRRVPGEYDKPEPDHDNCFLLKGPCWHDGSSLMATETFTPLWERCQEMDDMEPFWRRLEVTYERNFTATPA